MLKGGSFLIEHADPSTVFIPEDATEEQRMIAQMVKDFSRQEIQEPMQARGKEFYATDPEDRALIVQQLEKAGEMGLCGVAIPEEYGGMGLDFNTGILFSEAVADGFSFATTIGAQTSIGSLPIVYYGNEAQKEKYLPGIATGTTKASYCLTEPSAGSDANSGKTKALLNEAGTHYLLTGQKMWITNGGFADLFIVFAKIDDDKKLSAFIVEKDFGGIEIGAEEEKLGIKGSSTVQLFFNDCPVPVENLLGDREEGFKMALNILNTGRIKLAAGSIGGSKFAIDKAVSYAVERTQFRTSIAEFGAMQHKIGEMVVKTFVGESAVYRTGRNIDRAFDQLTDDGQARGEAKLNAVREFAVEAALLKFTCSEVLDYVIDEALQIHGGMGYAVETGIEMGYRDARITRIYEGTNEINRMLSVAELTKRIIKTKELSVKQAEKRIPRSLVGRIFKWSLDDEETAIQNLKYTFLFISGLAGRKLGKKLVDEQEMVMNMSDILGMAYLADSVWLRYKKLKASGQVDAERLEVIHKIAQVFIYDACTQAQTCGQEIIHAFAEGFQRSYMMYFLNSLTTRYVVNAKDLRRDVARSAIDAKGYPFHLVN